MPNKILQLSQSRIVGDSTFNFLFPYKLEMETYRPNGTSQPFLCMYVDASEATGTEFKDAEGKAKYLFPLKLDFLFDTMPEDIKTKHRELVAALLQLALTREMLPAGTVGDTV